MNIKISEAILEAIKKAMKDKSMNLSQMADAIQVSKSTLSRIINGQTKTMDPGAYDRLQAQFLIPYLKWHESIEKMWPKKPDENFNPGEWINILQCQVFELNNQIACMDHNFLELKEKNKELKSKLNKINKLSSD